MLIVGKDRNKFVIRIAYSLKYCQFDKQILEFGFKITYFYEASNSDSLQKKGNH